MKKSTLITTIAMIVVVVVALSTATYAWFSSSQVSVAQVDITTKASAEWMIFEGTKTSTTGVANETGSYTFSQAASDVLTLTPKTIQNGLWCPMKDFAHTIAIDGTTATVTSQPFVSAKAKTVGETTTYTTEGASALCDPFVLKVSNASGTNKTLVVSVIVNAGVSQSNGTLYAAAATVTNIAYRTTKADAPSVNKTTKFYKANEASVEGNKPITQNTTQVKPNDGDWAVIPNFDYKNATQMTQTGGTNKYTNFTQCSAAPTATEQKLGLAANEYYLLYSFEIADLAAEDSVYFSIYSWIDGWVADTSAGGAKYKIAYAFNSRS